MSTKTRTTRTLDQGFDAQFLSLEAKACCKALHFTPRRFEPIGEGSSGASIDDNTNALVIWNSRREITLTRGDLAYANLYLR